MARPRRPLDGNIIEPSIRKADVGLLTPKQLANFLQVSPSTIRRQLKEPEFPRVYVGNRVRFIPRDIINHLRKKHPGSEE